MRRARRSLAGEQPASRQRRRGPVMSDVARLAGVSHQTVSRVINDSRHVRPQTRERVVAAMRELGYQPNTLARALVTGRSSTLGVVSLDTTLYGPASALFAIERAAHEAGYFIVVASLTVLDRSSVIDAVERLRRHGVDGVIVIAPQEDAVDAVVHLAADLPLVAVDAGPAESFPVVEVDQLAGAASATRHLLDLGHKNVWHIAGPSDFIDAQQRVEGWRRTLEAAGVQPPGVLIGDWSARAGNDLGRRLAPDPAVSAVFVANDQMALGVLRAMHEMQRQIPAEVSVVGFDDIPEAPFFMPPLTTVRQDFNELGRRSIDLLQRLIEDGGRLAEGARVRPELVVRASTAAVRW